MDGLGLPPDRALGGLGRPGGEVDGGGAAGEAPPPGAPEGAPWRWEWAKASVRAKGGAPLSSTLHVKRHFGYRFPAGRKRGAQPQNARCSHLRAPLEAGNRPSRHHSARHRPICRPVQTFPRIPRGRWRRRSRSATTASRFAGSILWPTDDSPEGIHGALFPVGYGPHPHRTSGGNLLTTIVGISSSSSSTNATRPSGPNAFGICIASTPNVPTYAPSARITSMR